MLSHRKNEPKILPICEPCGQVFEADDIAYKHFMVIHNITAEQVLLTFKYFEKVICCEFCEAAFDEATTAVDHKKIHTGTNKYQCQYCMANYDQYSKLRTHCNSHNNVKIIYPVQRVYVCDEDACLKLYTDWRNLQTHRKTVHLINPSIFKCTQCDATFYQSWTYAYHKKSVHEKPTKCPFCDQTFVLSRSLQKHVNRMHVNEPPEPTTSQRKSGEKNKFDFDKHVQKVGVLYYCKTCEKKCSCRNNAIAHVQMVHMKIQNYFCDICNKGFYQRGDLTDHVRKVSINYALYNIVILFHW